MFKRILSFFIAVLMFFCVFPQMKSIAASEYILSPTEEFSGGSMNVRLSLPENNMGAFFTLDGQVKHTVAKIKNGGEYSFNLDLADVMAGRHFIAVKIKTPTGFVTEEKTVNIKKANMPYVKDGAYIYGGEKIWSGQWKDNQPQVSKEGYTIKLSEALTAFSAKLYYKTAKGKTVEIPSESTKSGEEITIIPNRAPGVSDRCTVLISNIEYDGIKADEDICFSFKPQDVKQDKILAVKHFNDGATLSGGKQSGGTFSVNKSGDEMALYMKSADGQVCESYVDLKISEPQEIDSYVVDMKIKIVDISGDAHLTLFDGKSDAGKWHKGIKIGSALKPYKGSAFLTDKALEKNKWVRIAAVYNTLKETVIYIDGKKVYTYGGSNMKPTTFRIDFVSDSDEKIEFFVDDYMVYEGTAPKEDPLSPQIYLDSIMDGDDTAVNVLGDDSVFSAMSDYYYMEKERFSYPSAAVKPRIRDEKAYVSTEFLSSVYGCVENKNPQGVTIFGKTFSKGDENTFSEEGDLYILADDIFSLMGKKYLYDNRGYFIVSDDEITAVNKKEIDNIFEDADYIHRFITFDNARGEEMLEDFKLSGEHPRILFTNEAINYINSHLDDSDIAQARERSVTRAVNSLNYEGLTENPTDEDKKPQATSWQSVINNLAEAYLMSGDEKYAQEGVRQMDIAAKWDYLALYRTRLGLGHYAMSMAIGYDSFYNYLNKTQEGRAKLKTYRDAMRRLIFNDTILEYRGVENSKWVTMDDNFLGVCGGGVMALVLAMADEEDFADIMPYLLENIVKTNQLGVSLYHRDGGYFEGVSYSNYLLKNLAIATEALICCMGTDYGYGNSTGFKDAGGFFVYMQTANSSFNFSDSGQGTNTALLPYWFAYRYGNEEMAHIHYQQNIYRSYINNVRDIYFYKKAVENSEFDAENVPLDKYYRTIETGTFRDTFMSGAPTFVGWRGGKNGMTHDQLDKGGFFFESDFVRWAHDLGPDSYDISGYFSVPGGYRIYRKKPEGENCLVINPSEDADTYFGQNTKGYAYLEKMETKTAGAYAVLNLTDVYTRDAQNYRRGYYFGDMRKTLTVQDELTLKKNNSELYWFMHTPASIEIISPTEAILTSGAQKLRALLYTNAPNAQLLDMNPEPLPSSPKVEGQAENEGRKLALHIPSASGDVKISVKLIPFSAEEATGLDDRDIDQWKIEDVGIDEKTFSLLQPQKNALIREQNIPVKIYAKEGVPTAYFDGKELTLKNEGEGIFTATVLYNDVNLGKHNLNVKLGNEEISRSVEVISSIASEREYTTSNLGSFANGTATTCEGADGSKNGGISLTRGEKNSYYHLSLNESGKTIFVEFDVKKPEGAGKFDLECKNTENYVWIANRNLILKSGQIADSNVFMPGNEWHNIRIVQQLSNGGIYRVYYDGKLIKEEASIYDMSKLVSMKIQLLSGSICLDNIKFGEYRENPRCISAVYGDANGEENADGDKIALNSQYVTMKFSPAFDSVGKSDVLVNGKTPQSVTVQGEYVKVVFDGQINEKEVKITFASSLKSGGIKINKATDVRFSVDFKSDKIDVGEIAVNGDSAKISANFEKGEISDFPQKGYFILASYKDDEMVNVALKTVDFSGKAEVCLNTLEGGDTLRAYLWTNEHKCYAEKEITISK